MSLNFDGFVYIKLSYNRTIVVYEVNDRTEELMWRKEGWRPSRTESDTMV